MKRSEMVDILVKELDKYDLGEYQKQDAISCLVDVILFTIEDLGMEPPTIVYWNSKNLKDINEKGIPKQLEHSIHNGDKMNKWETESD